LWKGGKQENSILKNEKKNLLASEELMYIISGTLEKLGKISKKNSLLFLRGK
tara:strand:- start:304 stop:459 length:156 start_codon:yes stop_codon:yes gene_type:complete